jgi:hypothetical protein
MGGHASLGGWEESARRAWVQSSSSQIDLAPSTRSFKHLPCDNQPNCVADISRMRWVWWMNKEQTKSTMHWWWNGLTLSLSEVAVCTVCRKWFLKVGCNVAPKTSLRLVHVLWSSKLEFAKLVRSLWVFSSCLKLVFEKQVMATCFPIKFGRRWHVCSKSLSTPPYV